MSKDNQNWCNPNLKGSYIGKAIELIYSYLTYLKDDDSNDYDSNFYYYIEQYFFKERFKSSKIKFTDIFTDSAYDAELYLKELKVFSLLQLFNSLAISILKAEYSLFDNYSKNLNELSGFYEITDKNVKQPKIIECAGGDELKILDHYLIKSFLEIFYHIISMCKIIDTNVDDTLINKNILSINTDYKTRITTIYPHPYSSGNKFIKKEIIVFFEKTIISIIDMTLIDHCYYINKENIDKLIQCFERISKFEDFIEKNIPLDILETDETVRNFKSVVAIVKYKSAVLLQQMVDCYNEEKDEEGVNKNFYSDFHFIITGTKPETTRFDEFFEGKLELNRYNYPFDSNFVADNYSPIIKSYSKEFKNYNFNNDFINIFTPAEEDFYKNNYRDKPEKTHQDIATFNKTSKLSIELYIKIKEITKSKDISKIEEFTKDKMYRLDPSAYTGFISILYEYLKDILEKKHKNDEIEKIYRLYEKIMKDYSEFINNEHYDVRGLRFFPPYHQCFYKLENHKIAFYPIQKENLPYIIKDDIPNYKNFTKNEVSFFFFMSLRRTPMDFKLLKDKFIDFQQKYIEIREKYRRFNAKKDLEDIVNENEKGLENQHRNHITVLGILGAFIALASGSVANWLVATNVIQFMFIEIGFIIALSCFAFLVRFRFNKNWKYNLLYVFLFLTYIGFLCGIIGWLHYECKEQLFESKTQEKPFFQNNIDQSGMKHNTYISNSDTTNQ